MVRDGYLFGDLFPQDLFGEQVPPAGVRTFEQEPVEVGDGRQTYLAFQEPPIDRAEMACYFLARF